MAKAKFNFKVGANVDNRGQLKAIQRNFQDFTDGLMVATKHGAEQAARIILEKAISYVPVDTGALAQSGSYTAKKVNKNWQAVVTFGGRNNVVDPTVNAPTGIVKYAHKVHETQVPFLSLGLGDAQAEIKEMFKQALEEEIS